MNKIFSIKSHLRSNHLDYENLRVHADADENNNESGKVPKYGIRTGDASERQLDRIMESIDLWGIDVFLIDELSNHRPLTSVAFTIFKV